MTGKHVIACIGRRRGLRHSDLSYLEAIGSALAERGFIVGSGGADGADSAFEAGALLADGEVWLFLPQKDYRRQEKVTGENYKIFWPAAHASGIDHRICIEADRLKMERDPGVRGLLTRNAMLARACHACLAAPDAAKKGWGGTGHTLRCIKLLGKPALAYVDGSWYEVTFDADKAGSPSGGLGLALASAPLRWLHL